MHVHVILRIRINVIIRLRIRLRIRVRITVRIRIRIRVRIRVRIRDQLCSGLLPPYFNRYREIIERKPPRVLRQHVSRHFQDISEYI